jgi:hypothetical protein
MCRIMVDMYRAGLYECGEVVRHPPQIPFIETQLSSEPVDFVALPGNVRFQFFYRLPQLVVVGDGLTVAFVVVFRLPVFRLVAAFRRAVDR